MEGYIPAAATELLVNGGEAVMLGPGALSRLMDLRHVRISGAKLVVLRRGLAVDLNIINTYIEIEDSDVLRVEGKAFNNIRGECHDSTLFATRMCYTYLALSKFNVSYTATYILLITVSSNNQSAQFN